MVSNLNKIKKESAGSHENTAKNKVKQVDKKMQKGNESSGMRTEEESKSKMKVAEEAKQIKKPGGIAVAAGERGNARIVIAKKEKTTGTDHQGNDKNETNGENNGTKLAFNMYPVRQANTIKSNASSIILNKKSIATSAGNSVSPKIDTIQKKL